MHPGRVQLFLCFTFGQVKTRPSRRLNNFKNRLRAVIFRSLTCHICCTHSACFNATQILYIYRTHIRINILTLEMSPPGRRRRGRPKQRWMDCVNRDMRAIGTTKYEVHDRTGWRRIVSAAPISQLRVSG